ncbi:MAG: hypothetical protein RJB15_1146 [Pseudomonadota bacterium]
MPALNKGSSSYAMTEDQALTDFRWQLEELRVALKSEKFIVMELLYPKIVELAKTLSTESFPGPNDVAGYGIDHKQAK